MQVARDVEQAAVAAGHPQVGAASVEHDHEVLRGSPQADLAVVLQRTGLVIAASGDQLKKRSVSDVATVRAAGSYAGGRRGLCT